MIINPFGSIFWTWDVILLKNTIYIHEKHTRRGIGNKLLKELLYVSKSNKNIKLIIAVIGSIDSKGSLKLHKKLGFKKTGVLKKIGFKNNKWIDSIFLQKILWRK